ncbi:RNA methyltransferase [Sedimentibacter sp.]|uniref:TrmH family RNA methyltransferase n=1 Tax=Sedimentibacter sp. TaxID=1960295 RepID=UPI0028A9D52C|nr:RNA methyltransferase [Sedimentibacter sp.]
MNIIKSKDNNKIKFIRSLASKKKRDEENAFIVEGIKFVKEAINENQNIMYLLFGEASFYKSDIKELYEITYKSGYEVYVCDDNTFNSAADTINAQGVIAVIEKKIYNIYDILQNYKFVIVCDRLQDPGNLGTIIRTSDAFGPAAVILNKGCVDIHNPKVVRASAGSLFRVPYVYMDSDIELIKALKEQGFKIISTVVESEYSFDDLKEENKICVVIGNEGQGVSREIIENSCMNITIRMPGRAESLNASIAAGISIYEIRKKLL